MSTVNKDLKLQSTYRPSVVVEGHIDVIHYRLRGMASQTGGAVIVYAKSESWGKWVEITKEEFYQLAQTILNPKLAKYAKHGVIVSTVVPLTPA